MRALQQERKLGVPQQPRLFIEHPLLIGGVLGSGSPCLPQHPWLLAAFHLPSESPIPTPVTDDAPIYPPHLQLNFVRTNFPSTTLNKSLSKPPTNSFSFRYCTQATAFLTTSARLFSKC